LGPERRQKNADENVTFVGVLSLAFRRQLTPTAERRRQSYSVVGALFVAARFRRRQMTVTTTDMQQNFRRRRMALTPTNIVGTLLLRLVFIKQR
jgi:hypothetical protein